jgi:hypothetical protein
LIRIGFSLAFLEDINRFHDVLPGLIVSLARFVEQTKAQVNWSENPFRADFFK